VERYSDWLDPNNDGFNMEKELLLLQKYQPIFDPVRQEQMSLTRGSCGSPCGVHGYIRTASGLHQDCGRIDHRFKWTTGGLNRDSSPKSKF
jgi:hypothetical protein